MKYWLAITNEENWKTIKKRLVYGFSDKNKKNINLIKKHDKIVFYIIPKRIGGFFHVKGIRTKRLIKFRSGHYPNQINLNSLKILKNLVFIDDKFENYQILENISIFKNKSLGPTLMGRSIIEMKTLDYKYFWSILRSR